MRSIQIAKDSFYQALRDRIAAANPARTMVLRGILRPAVLALENELPSATLEANPPADAFCLRWTSLSLDAQSAGALVTLGCEIAYATAGSNGSGGMDRGRMLAAMDSEVLAALNASSRNTPALEVDPVAGGGQSLVSSGAWNVFWNAPIAQAAQTNRERIQRVVTLEVFCYGN